MKEVEKINLVVNACSDVDECSDESMCGDNGDCANDVGSYHCVCNAGFKSVNMTCEGYI